MIIVVVVMIHVEALILCDWIMQGTAVSELKERVCGSGIDVAWSLVWFVGCGLQETVTPEVIKGLILWCGYCGNEVLELSHVGVWVWWWGPVWCGCGGGVVWCGGYGSSF